MYSFNFNLYCLCQMVCFQYFPLTIHNEFQTLIKIMCSSAMVEIWSISYKTITTIHNTQISVINMHNSIIHLQCYTYMYVCNMLCFHRQHFVFETTMHQVPAQAMLFISQLRFIFLSFAHTHHITRQFSCREFYCGLRVMCKYIIQKLFFCASQS